MREKDIKHPKDKIGGLKKILDGLLSKLIRDHEEILGCITCGSFNNIQAGHFRSRRMFSTRYDPLNLHAQCMACNVFQYGKLYEYGMALDARYGKGTAKKLYKKSMKLRQWEVKELIELIAAAKKGFDTYCERYAILNKSKK